MRTIILCLLIFVSSPSFAQKQQGFFNFEWKEDTGELLLEIPDEFLGERFLYVNALTAGVGSNDIGLDRGQLGDQRVVYFYKSGKKILLIEDNLMYRAVSDNVEEQKSVEEAFAKSVVAGFKVKSNDNVNQIDLSDFLFSDAHGIVKALKENKQGTYKVDKTRSAVYKEGLFAFPDNCEFEALVTYAGNAEGDYIKSVTPSPNFVTVRSHHSFIRLPDANYQPRQFMPESGYFYNGFKDYANPIGDDMNVRQINRHRLVKKDPTKERSEAVEPIVYYIDRGCPEPVRSALIEGAMWWNEAFEAAGFINAFQVKELPEDAHPLDVRYNLIQWVHRSTRGWSYGASISDPRTGEILKGHVSLGSLRVRQDYLIAQGIVSSFDENSDDPRLLNMALARLRQLSAHEVGHTLGLAHNFAASFNDRASVMDYPHPLILLDDDNLDLTKAYDVGIGEWDKRSIIYGYSYPNGSEEDYLKGIIKENHQLGFKYITDQDARPAGGMHPYAHLWDNGNDPIGELERIISLREYALAQFGENSLKAYLPYSELEKVLVPVYLMHRYQVDAVSKLVGGYDFSYSMKGIQSVDHFKAISVDVQDKAIESLLKTLSPQFLRVPESILKMIPPPAFGYDRDRETFASKTGSLFDAYTAAEATANHTLSFMLHPERLSRLYNSGGSARLMDYLQKINLYFVQEAMNDLEMAMMLEKLLYIHTTQLSLNPEVNKQVSAIAHQFLYSIINTGVGRDLDGETKGLMEHKQYLSMLYKNMIENPKSLVLPAIPDLPPGSPIGCH